MKSDHALAQPIFRNNIPIASIGKFLAATSCSLIQQPSTLSPEPRTE